jgi:hypothetical protein
LKLGLFGGEWISDKALLQNYLHCETLLVERRIHLMDLDEWKIKQLGVDIRRWQRHPE